MRAGSAVVWLALLLVAPGSLALDSEAGARGRGTGRHEGVAAPSDVESPLTDANTDADDANTARIDALLAEIAAKREGKRDALDVGWADSILALLDEAESLGSPRARVVRGELYLLGDGVLVNFTRAREEFEAAAESGVPRAQFHLGFMYANGLHSTRVEDRDSALAILNYYFAAVGGSSEAQMALGYRHLFGFGVPKSCNAAVKYYSKVAQTVVSEHIDRAVVSPVELVRLSNDRSRQNQLEETADVLQYYQHSADHGNVDAQLALGQLNYYGARGVEQNHGRAAAYFRAAANQGSASAMSHLAQMYVQGTGVRGDNETALQYYMKAAKQGDASAQNGLGYMYLHGFGTEKNPVQAIKYFKFAAEQGNADAQFNLGAVYFAGMGTDVDYGAALQYFTLAGHQGHVRSLFNLGQMHMNGLGTVQSCAMAVKLFKSVSERGPWARNLSSAHMHFLRGEYEASFMLYARAAAQGYELAQSNAAWMLENDMGYSRSDARRVALMQYQHAAKQGNVDANRIIGDYYYYGDASDMAKPDFAEAARYYAIAGELKNAHANFNLGFMHAMGVGLPRDPHLAKRFFDLALESSPNAYVPVQLALLALNAHQIYEDWMAWWDGTVTETASANPDQEPNAETTTTADRQASGAAAAAPRGLISEFISRYLGDVSVEDLLLIVACGVLAVMVYLRSRGP